MLILFQAGANSSPYILVPGDNLLQTIPNMQQKNSGLFEVDANLEGSPIFLLVPDMLLTRNFLFNPSLLVQFYALWVL